MILTPAVVWAYPSSGFGSAEDMIARYTERSDRDLSNLPWYVAFQHWRLAAISGCAAGRDGRPGRHGRRRCPGRYRLPAQRSRGVASPGLRPGHDDDLVVLADQPSAAIAAS